MDLCQIKCLQCDQPKSFDINPAHLHGLCEDHSQSIENQPLICNKCGSKCRVFTLKRVNIPLCVTCNNPADDIHTCKHYSCSDCRGKANNKCPKCVCLVCKLPTNIPSLLCQEHYICPQCFCKFLSCPWCQCIKCKTPKPESSYKCGHPACQDCLNSECKLCQPICVYCKQVAANLHHTSCKNHGSCPECFEGFVKEHPKKCHFCCNQYQKFQCSKCLKVNLNIQTVQIDGLDTKLCNYCLIKQIPEQNPDDLNNPNNLLPLNIQIQELKCHFCEFLIPNDLKPLETICKQGVYCNSCIKLGELDYCPLCKQSVKAICQYCNRENYLSAYEIFKFCIECFSDKVGLNGNIECVFCKTRRPICDLNEKFECNLCTGMGSCARCKEIKVLDEGLCENCHVCHVCGDEKVPLVLKEKCGHYQCQGCMTSNTSVRCSKCLKQYRCKEHNRIYFINGKDLHLKCCNSHLSIINPGYMSSIISIS